MGLPPLSQTLDLALFLVLCWNIQSVAWLPWKQLFTSPRHHLLFVLRRTCPLRTFRPASCCNYSHLTSHCSVCRFYFLDIKQENKQYVPGFALQRSRVRPCPPRRVCVCWENEARTAPATRSVSRVTPGSASRGQGARAAGWTAPGARASRAASRSTAPRHLALKTPRSQRAPLKCIAQGPE